jgi:hypothetical protein
MRREDILSTVPLSKNYLEEERMRRPIKERGIAPASLQYNSKDGRQRLEAESLEFG